MKKIVALIMLLSLTGCGYTTVDTGYRGVETHFGKVVSESLPEGLYWYNPFTSDVIQIDTRIQKWDGQTTAYTRDVQQATVLFTLNYRLDPTKAHIVYQSVGTDWAAKLVGQVVHESIKREFGQHEAVDMVSQRDKASRSIEAEVTANIDYTNEFEHAVEAKVVAQQKAIEEANRTKQIEEQKTQAILRAEGEAESIRIRANALAQNAKLVEWEAVQKWDGKMPQYMLGGAVPFIQMPAK
jgi:regulator of protease activity HflC (stomatin/prohibitin superfamily)